VATFNASLNRAKAGQLLDDLRRGDDPQIRNVAEVIRRVAPDVLLINEFDFDADGRAIDLFRAKYLENERDGLAPIVYPHAYSAEPNTGQPSGQDLDNSGAVVAEAGTRGYGEDALGFGQFPGQYGMVVLSKFPINRDRVKRFGSLLWKDMPGALLPTRPDGAPWYSDAALGVLRLSSKDHWDVPIALPGGATLHVLASHPTPPSFDGPEDRNGRRNHDEIRLWADYLTGGEKGAYLKAGAPPATFVLMGDQNADPALVDAGARAIDQLLEHPKIDAAFTPTSPGATEAHRIQSGANERHRGDPAADTADFNDRAVGNLRVDYVLPSKGLAVRGGGVFWPTAADPLARLTKMDPPATSDHRLVWLDLEPKAGP
jgi:3-phytase